MHNDSAGGRPIIMLPKSYVLKYIFWRMYKYIFLLPSSSLGVLCKPNPTTNFAISLHWPFISRGLWQCKGFRKLGEGMPWSRNITNGNYINIFLVCSHWSFAWINYYIYYLDYVSLWNNSAFLCNVIIPVGLSHSLPSPGFQTLIIIKPYMNVLSLYSSSYF
jgi:hypothetical protein